MKEWLASMDIHSSGGQNGRIRYAHDMLERVFRAKVTFITADATGPVQLRKEEQVRIVGEYVLWEGADSPEALDGQVTLSAEFYDELVRGAVPVDERVLSYFKGKPLAMDLYTWLTYRANAAWRADESIYVSWEQLWEQFPTHVPPPHRVRSRLEAVPPRDPGGVARPPDRDAHRPSGDPPVPASRARSLSRLWRGARATYSRAGRRR